MKYIIKMKYYNNKILILMKSVHLVPTWSNGYDSWDSPRRPGFESRHGMVCRGM